MTIKEMQEAREKLVVAGRERLEQIDANTDEARTAELESQHDLAMAELDGLDKKIERNQRQADAEARSEKLAEQQRQSRRPGYDGSADGSDDGELPSYREAFAEMLRSKIPEAAPMRPEAAHVLRQHQQSLPPEQRAQTVGTDSAGGYTVPTELSNQIIRSMLAWGPMYDPGVATEIVTSSGATIDLPTVNDTAVTAGAHTEAATLTDDGGKDVTFGKKSLEAYAFDTEWIRVSKELTDDSILAMETLLGSLLGERLGRIANLQLTTGSGSSAPNGIVTASTLGKTAAGTAAITWDEIIDLEHSVDPAYRQSPKVGYMFHDTTLQAVRKLKDGDGNYLWQAGNVQTGIPGSFNGRGYSINQAMAELATGNKVMLFGDFGKYFVRKVGAPLIGAIQDKDFWPGFGIAGYIRFDGELGDVAAVKHLITA